MRWALLSLAAAALLAPAAVANAAAVPDHRWTLRGSFGIQTPSDPLPGDALLAVSATRRLGTRFGVEALLGPGLPVSTLARDARGGQREVDLGSGLHAAVLLRLEQPLTASRRTVLSLASGPSFVSGDVFGTVAMERLEAGFEWRRATRAVLFIAIGYESVLTTSRRPFEPADCLQSSGCPPHYKAGAGQVTTRWGIAFTF